MIGRKRQKEKGKIKLSKYFQKLEIGERVSVIMELAVQPRFPKTLQGRSGIIVGKRGDYYIIKINDLNKEKTYIIHPVHLRRLK